MTENNPGSEGISGLSRFLGWLVTIVIPIILVLTMVRLLISPWYLELAYRTPGFPDDPYGFTMQERLDWGKIAVEYLLNDEGIAFLADLRFPEGQAIAEPSCQFIDDCTRVFNDRELRHMIDVKEVVQAAMAVLQVSLALLAISAILAWRRGWWDQFLRAVGRGGWLTVILLGSVVAFVLVAFSVIFVAFHEVFFEPGTWTFYYSDTLIRLFPERFWRDTFLWAAGIPALIGAGLGYFLSRK